jgi:hypothetical protein
MDNQNMKVLLTILIMMNKKCEVNIFDKNIFEPNALTKHLGLKNFLEKLQRHRPN